VNGLVQAYTYADSTRMFSADKPYYIENFFSAGAMYSTAEDLLKFDQGIFTYRLLKKATVDLMLTPHPALGNVGLGFWIAEKYGPIKTKFAYRPGGIYGSSANWIHVINSNRSIIALSNTNATDLFGMSQQLNAVATHAPVAFPVTATKNQPAFDATALAGTWTIDLRPSPNSDAYLKDFILTPGPGKTFSGEFYGSSFTGGQFLTVWPVLYFAFHTSDQANDYYHSGFIDGDTISGVSYSASRKFLSHWTGTERNRKSDKRFRRFFHSRCSSCSVALCRTRVRRNNTGPSATARFKKLFQHLYRCYWSAADGLGPVSSPALGFTGFFFLKRSSMLSNSRR
jgi:hypothetical protein